MQFYSHLFSDTLINKGCEAMENFYQDKVFLQNATAQRLYQNISNMPIIDYHCHISPKEIYEDKIFDNIGKMLLSGDHYKWRLMRAFGISEEYITGNMPWKEKFIKYSEAISTAVGNPLYHWTHMELIKYFGISTPLNQETAQEIWDKANAVIIQKQLSPRKLIKMSNVEFIATTDDIIDTLEFHKKIKSVITFNTIVTPTFRTDNLLLIKRAGYLDYINKLALASGVVITEFKGFIEAIQNRLDYFCEAGCKFSDLGIEYFPNCIGTEEQAGTVFSKALNNQEISDEEYHSFLGLMYSFLAGEYKQRNIAMQLHLAVKRNANSKMYVELGADCGGDCTGDIIEGKNIIKILDAVNTKTGLPKTIIYTLNPTMYYSILTIAGSFNNVVLGASWWYCDHRRGIEELLNAYAETGHLNAFLGMLTDSRSFLSYARHDYFRRILCSYVGNVVEKGEFADDAYAEKLLKAICYNNIRKIIGE
jgi:glucuronate isomerase